MPRLLSGKGEQKGPAQPKGNIFTPQVFQTLLKKEKASLATIWGKVFGSAPSVSMLAERHNHPIKQDSAVSARSHRQFPWFSRVEDRSMWEKKINQVTKDNQSSHGENLFLISLVLLRLEVTLKWYWIKVSWLTQSNWHGYREKTTRVLLCWRCFLSKGTTDDQACGKG